MTTLSCTDHAYRGAALRTELAAFGAHPHRVAMQAVWVPESSGRCGCTSFMAMQGAMTEQYPQLLMTVPDAA